MKKLILILMLLPVLLVGQNILTTTNGVFENIDTTRYDYIDIPYSADLQPENLTVIIGFTAVSAPVVGSYACLFGNISNNAGLYGGFGIWGYIGLKKLAFRRSEMTNAMRSTYSYPGELVEGEYTTFGATYDSSDSTVKLYKNGILLTTDYYPIGLSYDPNHYGLNIGSYYNTTNILTGQTIIDWIYYDSRAFTESEMLSYTGNDTYPYNYLSPTWIDTWTFDKDVYPLCKSETGTHDGTYSGSNSKPSDSKIDTFFLLNNANNFITE